MPHDCKGTELKPGDHVMLRCRVKAVHQTETACNVDVEAVHPGGKRDEYLPSISANSSLFERVEARNGI